MPLNLSETSKTVLSGRFLSDNTIDIIINSFIVHTRLPLYAITAKSEDYLIRKHDIKQLF